MTLPRKGAHMSVNFKKDTKKAKNYQDYLREAKENDPNYSDYTLHNPGKDQYFKT